MGLKFGLVLSFLFVSNIESLNLEGLWQMDGKAEFMDEYFHPTCQPICGKSQVGFSFLTSENTECPQEMSDFDEKKGSFAMPDEFCIAKVSKNSLVYP